VTDAANIAGRVKRRALEVPSDFDFRATVRSHGWCRLAPFAWSAEDRRLERPLRLSGGRVARIAFEQPSGRGTPVEARIVSGAGSRAGLDPDGWTAVAGAARRMLRLDEDLTPFYRLCRARGGPFDRAPAAGFGRLLRSPSLFEDAVKVLATTNTAWRGTVAMVANLVGLAGRRGAFPSAAEVAAVGARRLRETGRWGYRAEYLARFARRVARGTLDLGTWEAWNGTTEELEVEIRAEPGFGPYAASHVLGLLGRYDRIGIDTDFRSFVRRRHFPRSRKPPADRHMLKVYAGWGEWRYLAYWFDLWFDSYGGGAALDPAAPDSGSPAPADREK